MRSSRLVLVLALGLLMVDPAAAQTRRKDDSRRTTPREQQTEPRTERRRDRTRETDVRREIPIPLPPPRDEDEGERRRERRDRDRLVPIVVHGASPYDTWRDDRRFESSRYGYTGYGYGRGLVWERSGSCVRLDDELEWAHDEWHYRNDRLRDERWYDVEHALLELRIAEERAYSGCGRMADERDCRERGGFARTGASLEAALRVLEILLGDVSGRN